MNDDGPVSYSAFGLSLLSNRAISGLTPSCSSSSTPDVEIHLGLQPAGAREVGAGEAELYYVSSETDERGEPAFRIWRTAENSLLYMQYADGLEFWLARDGTALWCSWPHGLTIQDAAVYLLGPILGLLLRLRGVTCLHASAVAFDDHAVAFAGPPGAGKSTTAAALGLRGHTILSDDLVALEERDGKFIALPAHPYVCLWPESVEMLYGRQKTIPGFAATWDKGRMSLAEHDLRFQARPLPLGAVCLLGERTAEVCAVLTETSSPRESLFSLVANSFGTNLLEKSLRVKEFELLSRLVRNVPIWRVRPSEGAEKLGDLCEAIERAFEAPPFHGTRAG